MDFAAIKYPVALLLRSQSTLHFKGYFISVA
jgi:hypothetical protein